LISYIVFPFILTKKTEYRIAFVAVFVVKFSLWSRLL
jgi:hypothetical protein